MESELFVHVDDSVGNSSCHSISQCRTENENVDNVDFENIAPMLKQVWFQKMIFKVLGRSLQSLGRFQAFMKILKNAQINTKKIVVDINDDHTVRYACACETFQIYARRPSTLMFC